MNEFIIEVIKDINQMFYWQLKSTENKRILCYSNKFTRKEMCYKIPNKLSNLIGCEINFIDMNKFEDDEALDENSPYAQERI